jgi:glycosyltransferase involved in cell wall biosynthesis
MPSSKVNRSVSVVIPLHNEAGTVRGFLEGLYFQCLNNLNDYELILVEDGSTDGTREILLESKDKYPHMRLVLADHKLGYGPATTHGIQVATKEWVLLMDGDGQIEPADMWVLINSSEEYDIVLAEKFPRCDPVFRIFISRLFDVLTDFVLGVFIRDINFGFRIMRNAVARKIVSDCGKLGNIFNAEVAIRFVYGGYKIHQVRVRHRNRKLGKSQGVPPGRVISTSWRAFRGLFKLRSELTTQAEKIEIT